MIYNTSVFGEGQISVDPADFAEKYESLSDFNSRNSWAALAVVRVFAEKAAL